MRVATGSERRTDRADELRASPARVRFLHVPARRSVMIDGEGAPSPEAFAARVPALYGAAYGLRFALKARGVDERVGPLEGLWWTTDDATDLPRTLAAERDTWHWTLMIALPWAATDEEVGLQLAVARHRVDRGFATSLRVEDLDEGEVAQLLHVGPYAHERATIERLHAAIDAAGLRPTGRHHEIYLSDPRRSAPERLRTILRRPVR